MVMKDKIIDDAISAGGEYSMVGKREGYLDQNRYTFTEEQLTKFAALRDARKSEPIGSIVGYIDNEQVILKRLGGDKLEAGTKVYAEPPTVAVKDALDKALGLLEGVKTTFNNEDYQNGWEGAKHQIYHAIRNLIGEVK